MLTLPDRTAQDGQAYASPAGWSATITSSASGPRCAPALAGRGDRSVDPGHGHCGRPRACPRVQWPGSAQYVMGFTSRDAAGFWTAWPSITTCRRARSKRGWLALGELLARFAWNGVPVVMENTDYARISRTRTRSRPPHRSRLTSCDAPETMWRNGRLSTHPAVGQTAIDVDVDSLPEPYTAGSARAGNAWRTSCRKTSSLAPRAGRGEERRQCRPLRHRMAPRELGVLLRIARIGTPTSIRSTSVSAAAAD